MVYQLKQLFIVSLILLTAISCSQSKPSGNIKISTSFALSSAGFTGGLVVIATSGTQTLMSTADKGQELQLTIPDGVWKFVVTGWEGTTPFSGTAHCGVKTMTVASTDLKINIPASPSNCNLPEFSAAGFTAANAAGNMKPLKVFNCKTLVDSSLAPVSSTTTEALLSPFCDNNTGITAGNKDTARGIKIKIPATLPNVEIATPCLTTGRDPFSVSQFPLNTIPVEIELFDTVTCTDAGKKYSFPKGILSSTYVVNSLASSYNGLFLPYNYTTSVSDNFEVNFSRAAGQPTVTNSNVINYLVIFENPIDPATFTPADLTNAGSASVSNWTITYNSVNIYNLSVTVTSNGNVAPYMAAGSVLDVSGLSNATSSGGDYGVTYNAAAAATPTFSMGSTSSTFDPTLPGFKSEGNTFTITNLTGATLTGCTPPDLTGADANLFEIFDDYCGAGSLTATAQCTFKVRAKPNGPGFYNGGVVRVCAEAIAQTASNFSYTAPSSLIFSTAANSHGLVTVGKSSGDVAYTLRNQSPITISGCGAFSISGTAFALTGTTCDSNLDPYESCIVHVKASPTAPGPATGNLGMTCSSHVADYSLSVEGASGSATVSDIALGGDAGCLTKSDSTLHCWGYGNMGQLTDTRNTEYVPMKSSLGGVASIAMGSEHSCAIMADGSVKCWGQGPNGELGRGVAAYQDSTPVTVTGITNPIQLSLGDHYSCALKANSMVSCWGSNAYGNFGDGTQTTTNLSPTDGPAYSFTSISAGGNSTCGITSGGAVKCWGLGSSGQLGNGSNSNSFSGVDVTGLSGVVELASGKDFHCARSSDGSVHCWGNNAYGQLGNGATGLSNLPVAVPGYFSRLSPGSGGGLARHMCGASLATDTILCWGQNNLNQVGNGTPSASVLTPTPLSGTVPAAVQKIARGANHTCATFLNGEVVCWGSDRDGQLGRGHQFSTAPTQITAATNYTGVTIGDQVTCANTSSGSVSCWGLNTQGQLGRGTNLESMVPTVVPGVVGSQQLSGSGYYDSFSVCSRNATGDFTCWGGNTGGQLGTGTTSNLFTPATVSSIYGSTKIGGGSFHQCAISSSGILSCTGYGGYGQLGNMSTASLTNYTPATVLSGSPVTDVSGGYGTTFAVAGGNAYSFGYGVDGLLGNGQTTSSTSLSMISTISNVTKVVGIYTNACAIHDYGGTVSCWGPGSFVLGAGDFNPTSTPKPVSYLRNLGTSITQISGGYAHACALVDSTVWCWGGSSYSGEIGDGTLGGRNKPIPVLADVAKLWTGEGASKHSCAIKTNGTLWCWGLQQTFNPATTNVLSGVSGFR